MSSHVTDLQIDRMLGGELSIEQRAELDSHTAACESCAARFAAITVERDAFARRPMPLIFARAKRSRAWIAAPITALAAAALLVIVLRTPSEPRERLKGGRASLLLSAGSPDRLRPVTTNDPVHAGEYLQAAYTSARDGFGAVLSIDGAGQATSYVPASGDSMVALPAGHQRSFPGSTVLDEVTGSEVIALLWCETALSVRPLLDALRVTKELAAPPGCSVRIITLDKRDAR